MSYLFLDASFSPAFGQAGDATGFQVFSWSTRMNLACRLKEMADDMTAAIGRDLHAIDRLGLCTGPGSLTGLRVAMSFFRALALAGTRPLIGIDLFTWSARTLSARKVAGPVRLMVPAFLGQAFVTDLTLTLQRAGALASVSGVPSPAIRGTAWNPVPRFSEPRLASLAPPDDGVPAFAIRSSIDGATRLDPEPAVLHDLMMNSPAESGLDNILRVVPLYVVPSQAEMKWSQKHDHPGN